MIIKSNDYKSGINVYVQINLKDLKYNKERSKIMSILI